MKYQIGLRAIFIALVSIGAVGAGVGSVGAQLIGPNIAITRQNTNIAITFKGTLQSAQSVLGPWSDVPSATTPYAVNSAALASFFRARTADSIFASTSVVAFGLSGPFQLHFDMAFAGLPDGIFPPVREKPYFDGQLQWNGLNLPISLRVRGNSSLQECPFPKMKFKVSSEERAGTPFHDAREIKVGTHCAEGGRGTIGRLREQVATFREAQAYETMRALDFITPRVRRARLTYTDTTPTNLSPNSIGWVLTRDALILDDVEVLGQRLGGRALEDEEVAVLTNANFDPQLIANLQFLHGLLGNWDYRLSTNGVGLWNTEVIELSGGQLVPIAGDFDLASWVTGWVRFMGPFDYHPELPEIQRQARYELEQIKLRVSAAHFAAAKTWFLGKRSLIEAQISSALIDEAGRTNCFQHVTAFYDALTVVAR